MTQAARNQYETSKVLERESYESIYSQSADFSSADIRENFLFESEQRFRERIGALAPGKRVLEIGCGTGFHANLAAQAGAKVLAIDNSHAAIELARKRYCHEAKNQKLSFEVMDIDTLSPAHGPFD